MYMHMNTAHTHRRLCYVCSNNIYCAGSTLSTAMYRESCYLSPRPVCKARETGNRKLRMNALFIYGIHGSSIK